MAKYSYIHWSYTVSCINKFAKILMIATICDTFVWRFSCGYSYTHEALKQLASKTKHVGQYCFRLSCGYSRGIKVISKQNIKAKIALPSWIFTKTGERLSTSQTFLCKIPGLTLSWKFSKTLRMHQQGFYAI